MADRTLSFDIFARDRASDAFDKAGKSSEGLFGKLKGLGGFLAGGAIAAGAIEAGKAITGMVGDAVREAAESEKIARITENAIKATGGAAKITGDQVGELATRISNAAGVDDELIQSGANLLLTFKNIRNEAGKNNDVFNQATQAAVDLSAAGFGSVETASLQLGKALNDPLKGITALAKSGVTFTDQQKDQIKTLVESGKTLEAQKIILGEINAQVGGAAAAAADPMQKLGVVVGNLKERLGTALLPVVTKVAEFLADKLPTALDVVGGALSGLGRFLAPAIDLFQSFVNSIVASDNFGFKTNEGLLGFLVNLGDTISDVVRTLTQGVGDIGSGLVIDIAGMFGISEDDPRLEAIFTFVDRFEDVLGQVINFVRDNAQPILIGLGLTFATMVSPIGVLVGALIYAYTHFQLVRTVVDAVVGFLVGTVVPAIVTVASAIAEQFSHLVEWVSANWAAISEAIGHEVNAIQAIVGAVVGAVIGLWHLLGDDLLRIARGIWDQVVDTFRFGVELISGIIQVVVAVINGDFSKAGEIAKGIFGDMVHFIGQTLGNLGNVVAGALGGVFDVLRDSAGRFFSTGVDMIQGLISGIGSMAGALARFVADFIKKHTVDKVKDVLGISSPSKVFAELGAFTVAGFNVGIDRSSVSTIPFPAIGGGGVGAVAAAAATSAAGSMPVEVRVFLGDRELTDIVRTEVRGRDGRLVDALRAGAGKVG